MHPKGILALFLAAALALPSPMAGQQAAAPSSKPVAPSGQLKIVVIQGEGAINNIRARTATQPVVEVRDENDKPVAGAEVVFQLPAMGPGGVFHGWMRSQTVKTNAQGQAGTNGLVPNDEPGRFNIKVTAALGNKTGNIVIGQSNALRGGTGGRINNGRSGLWKTLLGVGAAGVVIGVVAATRNGEQPGASPNPITITPGPITVSTPR